jgi:hypothetical protein
MAQQARRSDLLMRNLTGGPVFAAILLLAHKGRTASGLAFRLEVEALDDDAGGGHHEQETLSLSSMHSGDSVGLVPNRIVITSSILMPAKRRRGKFATHKIHAQTEDRTRGCNGLILRRA